MELLYRLVIGMQYGHLNDAVPCRQVIFNRTLSSAEPSHSFVFIIRKAVCCFGTDLIPIMMDL